MNGKRVEDQESTPGINAGFIYCQTMLF